MKSETVDKGTVPRGFFASSLEESRARFSKYKSLDPFPTLRPALLNSADICDYVAKTGMLFPFDVKNLKSASYEVSLLGRVVYWDAKGERHSKDLARDEEFILVKNSIAFVTPEPVFHLPDYIAIRFNLKITQVHRGILLGTGPLVDPGFEGNLLIPLHNLTNNDYKFRGGEGFVWVEFTKLSENRRWTCVPDDPNRFGKYVPFPDRKKFLPPESLIEKALKGQNTGSIRSSIPESIYNAEQAAKESKSAADKSAGEAGKAAEETKAFKKTVYTWGAGGAVALVVALVTLAVSVYSTIQDSKTYVTDAKVHFLEGRGIIENDLRSLKERINELEKSVSVTRLKVDALQNEYGAAEKKHGPVPNNHDFSSSKNSPIEGTERKPTNE